MIMREKIEADLVVLVFNVNCKYMIIIENVCFCLLIAIVGAWIANLVTNADKNKSKISFKESLDLTDLPIITLRQGETRVNLLLDTGSTKSVILPSVIENLEYSDTGEVGTIFGMEGNTIETKYVSMDLMYNYLLLHQVQ